MTTTSSTKPGVADCAWAGAVTRPGAKPSARARRDDSTPWVAAFVLRMFSYDRIAQTLAQHGLVTEQLTGVTFPQRRFASAAEREVALREVSGRGLDPAGLEDTGRYHADFYLSRPAADVAQQPLVELLDGAVP